MKLALDILTHIYGFKELNEMYEAVMNIESKCVLLVIFSLVLTKAGIGNFYILVCLSKFD